MSSNKKRLTEQDVHMESSSSDSSDEEGQNPEAYTGNEVSLKELNFEIFFNFLILHNRKSKLILKDVIRLIQIFMGSNNF